MRLASVVPSTCRPLLRATYHAFARACRRLSYRPKGRDELHRYWRQPSDGLNSPEFYLSGEGRSEFLRTLLARHAPCEAAILEIGCNVGRDLQHLFRAGYMNLFGIEISQRALCTLREAYPELAQAATLHCAPVEEAIRGFSDGQFDVVFTMAVLEHIHSDSEWVFAEIVRVTGRHLSTIEDEREFSWRHFPRNYRRVFEPLGLQQVEEVNCRGVEGLSGNFVARVFTAKRG